MYKLFSFIFLLNLVYGAAAQKLSWVDKPHNHTFLFQIEPEEVAEIIQYTPYKDSIEKYLHTLVFDLPNQTHIHLPKEGHYIHAQIEDNTVHYDYRQSTPFDLYYFREYGKLTLQIVDKMKQVRKDAIVRVASKNELENTEQVEYDSATRTYRIPSNRLGKDIVLTVELDGFKAWYMLEKLNDYRNYNRQRKSNDPVHSYMVTDKNKYRPGDTLRFKTYAVSRDKKPLTEPLQIRIQQKNYKYKTIQTIQPYHSGGYAGEIVLHDSLELSVNTYHALRLENENGQLISRASFLYEDYELDHARFTSYLSRYQHMTSETNTVHLELTDANGFAIPEAFATITVLSNGSSELITPFFLLPDTIWQGKVDLSNQIHTEVEIPISSFPAVDFDYTVKTEVYIPGFELQKSEAQATHSAGEDISYQGEYELTVDAALEKGILKVMIENPDQLPFSWFIYGEDRLVAKGEDTFLDRKFKVFEPNAVHYIEVFVRGNTFYQCSVVEEVYPQREGFRIETNLPGKIYPGQKIDATLTIYTPDGKPAKNVDVTAWAWNDLLDYTPATLPYYGPQPYHREPAPYFKDKKSILSFVDVLNYDFLSPLARLDTLEYYQFVYPRHAIYKTTVDTPDGTTQFAPFIMQNGTIYKVNAIECDGVPVWFSWTDFPEKYAVRITADVPHSIRLYAGDALYTIDSITFEKGKKTIFSVDLNYPPGEKVNTKKWDLLSLKTMNQETFQSFTSYITQLRYESLRGTMELRQGTDLFDLGWTYPYDRVITKTIGPILPGWATYKDSISFYMEGGKQYDLTETPPQISELEDYKYKSYTSNSVYSLKYLLREFCEVDPTVEYKNPFPRGYYVPVINIDDTLHHTKLEIHLPEETSIPGIEKLIIYPANSIPEAYRLLKDYGNYRHYLHREQLTPGTYQLAILFIDGSYVTYTIELRAHHRGIFRFRAADLQTPDDYSVQLLELEGNEDEKSYFIDTYIPPPILSVIEDYYEDEILLVSEDSYAIAREDLGEIDVSNQEKKEEQKLYEGINRMNRLRARFSDVAFWQPSLVTDKKGQARFKITFPDNITQWNTRVYAMNEELKTGTFRKKISSYTPIVAELQTPRYLIEGDSTYIVGMVRNLTAKGEPEGRVEYTSLGIEPSIETIQLNTSWSKTYPIFGESTKDGLISTFEFIGKDGFRDGEERNIPVLPAGTEIAHGFTKLLQKEEIVTIQANQEETIYVQVATNQIDLYIDAMKYLHGYEYACNEQLASKIKGMLSYRLYMEYKKEPFLYDKELKAMIKRLADNQNEAGLWSWWGKSMQTSNWMSAHILEALNQARDAGYEFYLYNSYEIKTRTFSLDDLDCILLLPEENINLPLDSALNQLAEQIEKRQQTSKNSFLREKLLLWEALQKQGATWIADSIQPYLVNDPMGTVFCADGLQTHWRNDLFTTTLIAYRIVRNEPSLQKYMEPMQAYILASRTNSWNTYQASTALTTVLPDLITASENSPETQIKITGKENQNLRDFPYQIILSPGEKLSLQKQQGTSSVFYTAYSIQQVTTAKSSDAFEITTAFKEGDILQEGKIVTLDVYVKAKLLDSGNVMIEVPIPAGCRNQGYTSTNQYETWRENFKEKVVIFCESLPAGEHHFTVELLPRFTGIYHLNPAKVSLMYHTYISACNDMRQVVIVK